MEYRWTKSYDEGVPNSVTTDFSSLCESLEKNTRENPLSKAFICLEKETTFKDFMEITIRIACGLQELNVKKGDRVALMSPNLLQFPAVFFACLKIGAILVPINPLLTTQEISQTLKISDPKVFIYVDLFVDKINALKNISHIEVFVESQLTDFASAKIRILYLISQIFKKKESFTRTEPVFSLKYLMRNKHLVSENIIDKEDTAILLCTGGTTGTPKLAALTNSNLMINAMQVAAWVPHIREGSIVLAALPFFHSFGLTLCLNAAVLSRVTILIVPQFKIKKIVSSIRKYSVSYLPGVPIMFAALNRYMVKENIKLSSLEDCCSGGTELISEIQEKFEGLCNVKILEAYGLTEASPGVTCNPSKGLQKAGSVGLPFPSTEVKIVNIETHEEMPVNGVGEILVKGPQGMKEYFRDEEESKQAFRDGWLLTGDLGRMDEDGYLYITGRIKEMIINSGFKVYPQQVERVLCCHDSIKEAGVCGIPDGFRGEAVKDVVVLSTGSKATE